MSNNIDLNISVLDKGNTLKQRNNEADKLGKTIERVNQLTAASGTKSGAQAMRRAGFDPDGGEVADYNRARGAAGAGGASARDFADQARGLGGLVRLYATWAANIFAVTAAFNALRDAMQTEVMMKSLNQLGASTGISLGGIAKEFANATDGMISLREAAEATAKAMSSGMTRDQFLQLGQVAKGAAQALGLNMSDAVSRLTRGITKLEPELLDELGLFTKVGKAAEDYARKVGKAESQLTDFERRQAFANAVIAEGQKKFGDIAQTGNPYDQLLAELKNTAQDILSVINTIVSPIAKLLADNTGLIGAAILGAAYKITRQALPELAKWNKGLKDSADQAKARAGEINEQFQFAFSKKVASGLGIPNLEANVAAAKKQLKDAQAELAKVASGEGMDKRVAQSKWFGKATSEDVINEKSISKLNELNAKYANDEAGAKQKVAQAAQKVLDAQKQLVTASTALEQKDEKLQDVLQERSRLLSGLWQREEILRRARAKAADLDIRSRVGENVDRLGVLGGIGELYKEAQASKDLSNLGKIRTVGLGTFQALARGADILVSSLSRITSWIAGAYIVFQLLDGIFNSNAKQVKILSNSLDQLEETANTSLETLQKWSGSISAEAVIARANSFDGLTLALKNVSQGFEEARKASGLWDRFWDGLAEITPFVDSLQEKTSKQVGAALAQSIKNLPAGQTKSEFQTKLRQILEIDPKKALNADTLIAALENIDSGKIKGKLRELAEQQSKTNEKFQEANVYLKGLKDSEEQAEKAMTSFMNSLKNTSPLSQFFETSIKYSVELGKALGAPDFDAVAGAMDKLSKTDLSRFGSQALALNDIAREFKDIQPRYEQLRKVAEGAQAQVDQLKKSFDGTWRDAGVAPAIKEKLKEQQQILNNANQQLADIEDRISQIANTAKDLITKSTLEQVKLATKEFDSKMREISNNTLREIMSKLPVTTVEGVRLENELNKRQIDIETEMIKSQAALGDSIDLLRIQISLSNDIAERDRLDRALFKSEATQKRIQNLDKKIAIGQNVEQLISSGTKDQLEAAAAELPGLFSIIQRRLSTQVRLASQEQKRALNDYTSLLKELDITVKQDLDRLRFQLESLNQAISTIGSDTPEKLSAQINLTRFAVQREREIIIQEEKKLLDQQVLQRDTMLKQAKDSKARGLIEETFAANTNLIKTEADRKKLLLDQKSIYNEQVRVAEQIEMVEKRSQELAIKRLEAQKTTTLGSGIEAEKARAGLEAKIRDAQDKIAAAADKKALKQAEDRLQSFRATILKTQGDQPLTPEQDATLTELTNLVDSTKQLNKEQDDLRSTISGAAGKASDFNISLKEAANITAQINAQQNAARILDDQYFQKRMSGLDFEKQRLDILNNLGMLTADEIKQQQVALDIRRIELDLDQNLANLDRERILLTRQLTVAKLEAGAAEGRNVSGDAGVIAAQQAIDTLDANRRSAISRARDAVDMASNQLLISDRFENYAKEFKDLFDGMADSIVQFSKTGKFEFKSLINSFLDDILRYELRLQMHALYVQTLRPLLSGVLSALGLGGSAISIGAGSIGDYGFTDVNAMGNVYDAGLRKYAKGGMFTNDIVASPTLFKYAKGGLPGRGLGLMGEAGPEAIMPLRRDSQGNLGVIGAQQGNVEIVVNNYTSQKAETKETVDARGNRRVEVVIGDIVADQMTSNNSSVQQAMLAGFGAKPRMVRR